MPLSRLGLFLLCAVIGACTSLSPALGQAVVIGGKDFTEQLLLAEMTGQLLRAKGYQVQSRTGFSSSGVRREQEAGLVDVYWEYTGTSLISFNGVSEKLGAREAYERVKDLDARKGLVWLSPSRINNTYALAMRKADAAEKRIRSISDLAARLRQGEKFKLACNTEFFIRPDGLMPLQRAYGFEFEPANVVRMGTDKVYDVLSETTDIDVGLVFSTDGRVAMRDFLVLRDDRDFFPSYLLTPVVRQKALDKHPDLAAHLEALSSKLDNPTIASLNAMIDVHGMPVGEVASAFLRSSGLI
jgi:osmoprotectant transport system substrate-binding protein